MALSLSLSCHLHHTHFPAFFPGTISAEAKSALHYTTEHWPSSILITIMVVPGDALLADILLSFVTIFSLFPFFIYFSTIVWPDLFMREKKNEWRERKFKQS